MQNINVFGPVFHEKKFFKYLSFFSHFLPLNGTQKGPTLHLNKSKSPSPTDASYQVWLKQAHWFLRRWMDRRMADAAPCLKLSWPLAR